MIIQAKVTTTLQNVVGSSINTVIPIPNQNRHNPNNRFIAPPNQPLLLSLYVSSVTLIPLIYCGIKYILGDIHLNNRVFFLLSQFLQDLRNEVLVFF